MEYNMLLLVHSLEKGMSLKNIKYGYGKQKIESLIQLINEYRKKFFYENNYAYEESISILKSYLNLHKNVGFNIGHLEKDICRCPQRRRFLEESRSCRSEGSHNRRCDKRRRCCDDPSS